MNAMSICYALNKPFGVLSQFTNEGGHPGLGSLGLMLPTDVYPIGRLDRDSEGLLLLSNDSNLIHELLEPRNGHPRTYHVQVEGSVTREHIESLIEPMELRIKKKQHRTKPCRAKVISDPNADERVPPIRERKSIPAEWIQMRLTEGKNRQVRKMTAHVGLPTLRLIRTQIGDLSLDSLNLKPGQVMLLNAEQTGQALSARSQD
jgi:23S rRNA pseudouridine2457 synthase